MKNKRTKKIIIGICALVTALAVTVGVVIVPRIKNDDTKNYSYTAKKQTGISYSDNFDVVLKGNAGQLRINSDNACAVLLSSNGETVFNSCSDEAAEHSFASILSLRMRDEHGNSYTLNSTDNSVRFGTFDVNKVDKTSVYIKFDFYPDEKAAEKKGEYLTVPVLFSCESGNFKVSVNTSEIVLPNDYYIEKLSILPGLFSVGEGTGNARYILPDGCGAQMDLNVVSEKALELNLAMYGTDVAFYDYSQGAVLPFFAVAKGGCLVNTLITGGDALSEISCKRYETSGGYLYNTFTLTACGLYDGKFRAGETYKGEISQTYVITDNGDYNNVAEQVRDNLVSRGYLPDEMSGKFVDMPFFVNVLGSADGKTVSSTFEDAAEITAVLKTRGVRNIALRFSGAGKRGLLSVSSQAGTFSSALGGKDGYTSMVEKTEKQGNTVWLDVNLCAAKVDSKNGKVKIYETPSKFAGFNVQSFSLNSVNKMNSAISENYKAFSSESSGDVCINDASQFLYTDVNGGFNRQQVLENLKEKSSALSVNGSLMLSYPAVYLMKNADAVFTIPDTASCGASEGVTEVPVLQTVLHGSVMYGSAYINVTNLSSEDALLKAVEYGAAPSFLFTHDSASNLNYNLYTTSAAQLYAQAKKLLPLMDMKITSHELLVDGVYKITYDYNKVVYVNYNPSVVEVNGVMVSAKDFVVI